MLEIFFSAASRAFCLLATSFLRAFSATSGRRELRLRFRSWISFLIFSKSSFSALLNSLKACSTVYWINQAPGSGLFWGEKHIKVYEIFLYLASSNISAAFLRASLTGLLGKKEERQSRISPLPRLEIGRASSEESFESKHYFFHMKIPYLSEMCFRHMLNVFRKKQTVQTIQTQFFIRYFLKTILEVSP